MDLMARLSEISNGRKAPERTEYVTKEPFDLKKYESIPVESRPAYVAKTRFSKPYEAPIQEQPLDVTGDLKNKVAVQDEVETKASNIHRAFSPLPESDFNPEQPAEQAPVATEAPMDWSGFIPALASLGTEALMGSGGGPTQGESLGISSKFLLDNEADKAKQRRTLEEALRKAKQDRDLAAYKASLKASTPDKGSRRFVQTRIVDPKTKKTIVGNYDTFTGQYTLPNGQMIDGDKIEAGYSVNPYEFTNRLGQTEAKETRIGEKFGRGTIKDPNTGMMAQVRNGQIVPIQEQVGKLNNKQEKDLNDITGKFLTTDLYQKTAQSLSAAVNVDKLISAAMSGNAIAANSARVQLARMSGEVGALSDSDIERSGGSPAIKEIARRFAMLQKSGVPLSDRDMQEIKNIARIYEAVSRRKIAEATANMENDYVKNYGGVKGAVSDKMKTFIPSPNKAAAPKKPTFEEWKKLKGL